VAEDKQGRAAQIVRAGLVLARHGLVTAFGHVSARSDQQMVITPAADLAEVTTADLVFVDLDAAVLPPGAPAEAWAHLRLYAARPDVSAIARAQPPAAFAVAAVTSVIRPLHGQASWVGDQLQVHEDARLLRSAALADAAISVLGQGNGLLLRGNGALTCGASPGEAVTRMWLLSGACEVWLSAAAAGRPGELSADELASWRAAGPDLLPRLWQHLSRDVP
jgi:HCOMODA/2-hydroxy-3-carboxy-muconic semialdehyde decarboxylase